MRRTPGTKVKGSVGGTEGEQGFWSSYADMMSSFALILFFLMLLAYIQNLITGDTLRDSQKELEQTKLTLSDTLREIEQKKLDLLQLQVELDSAQADLDSAQQNLSAAQLDLDAKQTELDAKQTELDSQQTLIDTQADYLAAANEEILRMRSQMQTIVGVREKILRQITDGIVQATGDASKVSIGNNGSIILNEGVFFDTGSAEIRPESALVLNELTDGFSRFLTSAESSESTQYIDSIVIAGHTDSDGEEDTNRTLSTSRANSVLNYLLSDPVLGRYAEYFCASGYGETRPVADNATPEGRAQNRRIEVSIILRDDTVMDIVNEYLNIAVPET